MEKSHVPLESFFCVKWQKIKNQWTFTQSGDVTSLGYKIQVCADIRSGGQWACSILNDATQSLLSSLLSSLCFFMICDSEFIGLAVRWSQQFKILHLSALKPHGQNKGIPAKISVHLRDWCNCEVIPHQPMIRGNWRNPLPWSAHTNIHNIVELGL